MRFEVREREQGPQSIDITQILQDYAQIALFI